MREHVITHRAVVVVIVRIVIIIGVIITFYHPAVSELHNGSYGEVSSQCA